MLGRRRDETARQPGCAKVSVGTAAAAPELRGAAANEESRQDARQGPEGQTKRPIRLTSMRRTACLGKGAPATPGCAWVSVRWKRSFGRSEPPTCVRSRKFATPAPVIVQSPVRESVDFRGFANRLSRFCRPCLAEDGVDMERTGRERNLCAVSLDGGCDL